MRGQAAIVAFVLVAGGILFSSAAVPDDLPAALTPQVANTTEPWTSAGAVVKATQTDIAKGGVRAIGPHADDLEQALMHAGEAFGPPVPGDGPIYLLVDSPAESLMALIFASSAALTKTRHAVTVPNPYPAISFYLGSYYNDIGKSDQALRVLDAGLALPTAIPGANISPTLPHLLSERGAALNALKQWPDALADYDRGLAIKDLKAPDRAILLRGRGFALTELDRLDEAETSYRDSLVAEPNNARALNELNYIAKLRAGAPTRPGGLILKNAPNPR